MLPRPNFSRGYFHLWLSLPVNGLAFPYRVSSFLFLLIITYHKISALRQLFDKNGCCIWQTWSLSTFLRALFSMLSWCRILLVQWCDSMLVHHCSLHISSPLCRVFTLPSPHSKI